MQQVINAIVLSSCYCLFAVGLSLTWSTLNILNLAHGSVFVFSAFTCFFVTSRWTGSLPVPVLVLIAIATGAVLELVSYAVVFRVIFTRSANLEQAELAALMASIGLAAIPVVVARQNIETTFPLRSDPIEVSVYHFGDLYVTSIQITIVVAALVCTVGLALWLSRSRTGRSMRALACDPETSGLMGINQRMVATLTLVISGALAGLAGAFFTLYFSNLAPESGGELLLKAFAVIVIGGVGSIWGSLVGAFLLGGVETYVIATTSGTWTQGVSFAAIIIVLLLAPNGLFNRAKLDRV